MARVGKKQVGVTGQVDVATTELESKAKLHVEPSIVPDPNASKVPPPAKGFANQVRAQQFALTVKALMQKRTTHLTSPKQIAEFALDDLKAMAHRLAVGGFFQSPTVDHYQLAKEFIEGLVKRLGAKDVALVTSDTTRAFADGTASTDHMSTMVAHETGAMPFYVSSLNYQPKLDMNELPTPADMRKWANTPRFVLPTSDEYGTTAMTVSNAWVNIGGRVASVSDFVKIVNQGKLAVLVNNTNLNEPAWDAGVAPPRPGDASKYLSQMLATAAELHQKGLDPSQESAYPFPFMANAGLDGAFMKRYAEQGQHQVLSIDTTRKTVAAAIEKAAQFFEAKS